MDDVSSNCCICDLHALGYEKHTECSGTTHKICVCAKEGTSQYIQCKVNDAMHFCICERDPNKCKYKSGSHVCVCDYYDIGNLCRGTEHPCVCKDGNPSHCKVLKHHCICESKSWSVCKSSEHNCICRCSYYDKYPNPMTANCRKEKEHRCICQIRTKRHEEDPKTNILFLSDAQNCLSEKHQQVCLCSFGFNQMKHCPSKKSHMCLCKSKMNLCRQHKTFDIWNLWKSTLNDSFFIWIPEEVLIDCLENCLN